MAPLTSPGPMHQVELIVAAAGAGDQRAWDALVRRFDPMLRRVVSGFRLPPDQVDDALQATWLRLFRHVQGLENPGAVGGWLATTARRESLRVLQRATREVPMGENLEVDEPDPYATDALDALADAEQAAAVRAALLALPPHERALVELLIREPAPTYDDIATELAIPVGSIGPTRGRALARLRRLLTV